MMTQIPCGMFLGTVPEVQLTSQQRLLHPPPQLGCILSIQGYKFSFFQIGAHLKILALFIDLAVHNQHSDP